MQKAWTAEEVMEAMRQGIPIPDNDLVKMVVTGETHCCPVGFFEKALKDTKARVRTK
jgi:hypothetical protein